MKFIHNIKKKKKEFGRHVAFLCVPTLTWLSQTSSDPASHPHSHPLIPRILTKRLWRAPGPRRISSRRLLSSPAHSFHCPHPRRPSHPSGWVGRVLITGVISKLRATGPQIQRSHLQKQITIWEGRYSHSRTNNTVGPQKTIPE